MKHIIRIEQEHRQEEKEKGFVGEITHLITLSNITAFNTVLEYLLNLEWLDDLDLCTKDICVWDGE